MSKHKHHGHDRRQRREQFTAGSPQSFSWNVIIIAVAIVFFGVIIMSVTRGSTAAPSTARSVERIAAGRDFGAAAATFADGQARFFEYATAAGRMVSFFIMRSSDGVIRAAADACTVCYRERRGYRQQGDAMVCNNCNKSFRSVDINVITGGCNPIPLERTIDGDRVVIRAAALEQAAAYF